MAIDITKGLNPALSPELTKTKKNNSPAFSYNNKLPIESKKQSNNDIFSQGINSGVSKFASLFPADDSTPGGSSLDTTSNSTPKIYKNLNTNLKSLGTMTTDWGDSTRYENFHPGIDIANKTGTPIPTVVPGTITSVETGHKQGDKGYGNTITVTDAQGNKHRYSHLNQIFVKVGQPVGKGEEIGTMGNSGSTYSPSGKGSGTHLDYRIVDMYNKYINPYTYLKNLT